MPWDHTIARATQHYGRRFDYLTKSVACQEPELPPLPPFLSEVLERLTASQLLPWEGDADQITVNEYMPGMGIAPHVDTHSAFEDGIAALSLGSGVAMRLRHAPSASCVLSSQSSTAVPHSEVSSHSEAAGDAARRSSGNLTDPPAPPSTTTVGVTAITLWLPPRSLLAFVGASRYEWEHSIPMRKTDFHESSGLKPRGRRVSVTMRRIRDDGCCACCFPWACDSQGGAPIEPPTRIPQRGCDEAYAAA